MSQESPGQNCSVEGELKKMIEQETAGNVEKGIFTELDSNELLKGLWGQIDLSNLIEDDPDCKEEKAVITNEDIALLRKVDNTVKYQYLDNATPEEAFKVFYREWKGWLFKKSLRVAEIKGLEREDVEQFLLHKAWEAASDSRFDRNEGKTIIGWISQRVIWYVFNLLRQKHGGLKMLDGESLESYRFEDSDLEPEDHVCKKAESGDTNPYLFMNASKQMSDSHRRLEYVRLLDRVIEEIQKMKPQYGYPLMELFQPSSLFKMFMKRREGYDGAALFETCGIKDLVLYMESLGFKVTKEEIDRSLNVLRNRIKELKDL